MAIKGMTLPRAQRYLNAVLDHRECIPYRRFVGCAGRTAQAKNVKSGDAPVTQGRWPEKSCRVLLGLLTNLESNARLKDLDVSALELTHVQVNQAVKGRRRTYRAHGRINAFMSCPAHVEIIATEKARDVAKAAEFKEKRGKQRRLAAGKQ
jgi:large subunit ribosomal protein L17e